MLLHDFVFFGHNLLSVKVRQHPGVDGGRSARGSASISMLTWPKGQSRYLNSLRLLFVDHESLTTRPVANPRLMWVFFLSLAAA